MELNRIEQRLEKVRQLAREQQQQGERCALAGLLEQATAILAQVWMMTQEDESDVADAAAWEAGWSRLQTKSYDEAATWFSQVGAIPVRGSRLWPSAKQTLVQLCLELAERSTALAPPPGRAPAEAASPRDPSPPRLPRLSVKNLGQFQIARAEAVLPICTKIKAISLFRYLLSRRHQAARKEELQELFWPDAPPRAATHSLQVVVTTLRRYLDPPTGSYLLFQAGHYMINPDAPVEDDCCHFEQRSDAADRYWRANDLVQAQQAYADAIAGYQGDYCVGDQDLAWAIAEQERLLARYLLALDHLGQIFIASRNFEPAIECYQRLLERDSYREDAHCQLMRCYWQLGRRTAALRQYKRCATILASDLGLDPMEETLALYRAISTQDVPN